MEPESGPINWGKTFTGEDDGSEPPDDLETASRPRSSL